VRTARRPRLPTVADVAAHVDDAVALLKALSNGQRLLLVCCLVEGECSVGELNARAALSQSALSQHLAVLRSSGLVLTRRQAQAVYYRLAQGPALKILEALHAAYCAKIARPPRGRRGAPRKRANPRRRTVA
jgi:DNA-binding transcriptional ArsR family regulator